MRPRRLDAGQIVLVVAAATGLPAERVVDGSDLTLLSMITRRSRDAATSVDAMAAVLVGVAAGRPFPTRNGVAAWALTALVADNHRVRLHVAAADAAALVRDAASGRLDEAEVAAVLATALGVGRRSPLPPAPAVPELWACPRCARPVPILPYRSSILVVEPSSADVVSDCAARHRAHAPSGIVRTYPAAERYDERVPVGR